MEIDTHLSVGEASLREAAAASLQGNRIDPKFLYVTPRQTELWRQVFLKHSPIQGNPEFARIYHDAFMQIVDQLAPGKVVLVGLGCGTGAKERDLCLDLKARGHEILFAAIDISRDLVLESAGKLVEVGAGHRCSLVCDLAEAEFIGGWLDDLEPELPRLITFFGLTPNLAPSVVAHLFRSILRPGDIVLASAHLVPTASEERDAIHKAMESVLPQYDNPETLAWLAAAIENWGLENRVGPPMMEIGEVEGIPAFVATAKWKNGETFEQWGQRFAPKMNESLKLFHSLRYTPALFEKMLEREGFGCERLALTSCGQEAIWAVKGTKKLEVLRQAQDDRFS